MRRTNIYLEEPQLAALRHVARTRGESVASLVRSVLDEWLEREGVRALPQDEWQRRFDALLQRRARVAASMTLDPDELERDVTDAVRGVRRARAARRR